ncbi:ATP phosphoribosyltransferase [Paenimyroides aquimaris]|uniref:ATP phosphoribosyltransferase n=1 Tax=Paenimyroides marinum TaxID=1159016 RepID=A0A1H6JW43_9FLAO|nr:ATP phosphoribosyltransferase [Paenimyroides aquimaris]SEH65252.1 ATP phosphoribosyltransferase [Paenimyroides aquimaris]
MSKLKIAIQKSGRLSEKSIKLLEECGIKFPNGGGKLITEATNFPIEILFLRDDDIPQYVEQQVADLGIIGENVLVESKKKINLVEKLGFSSCRLSLAVPKETQYESLEFFRNKRIATSYPNILSEYFQKLQIEVTIEVISGSVEIAPGIGLADGICDIVSSGSTLLSNGLKEVEKVLDSQAVLVANHDLEDSKKQILEKLLFRIQSVRKAKENKYILLNTPNSKLEKIKTILPGMNSPTILPLAKESWSSLHSVIREDKFWEVIDELKEAGAEGILVIPIEKMIV